METLNGIAEHMQSEHGITIRSFMRAVAELRKEDSDYTPLEAGHAIHNAEHLRGMLETEQRSNQDG